MVLILENRGARRIVNPCSRLAQFGDVIRTRSILPHHRVGEYRRKFLFGDFQYLLIFNTLFLWTVCYASSSFLLLLQFFLFLSLGQGFQVLLLAVAFIVFQVALLLALIFGVFILLELIFLGLFEFFHMIQVIVEVKFKHIWLLGTFECPLLGYKHAVFLLGTHFFEQSFVFAVVEEGAFISFETFLLFTW